MKSSDARNSVHDGAFLRGGEGERRGEGGGRQPSSQVENITGKITHRVDGLFSSSGFQTCHKFKEKGQRKKILDNATQQQQQRR